MSLLSIPLDQKNGYFFGLVFEKIVLNQEFSKPEAVSSTACPGVVYFVNV